MHNPFTTPLDSVCFFKNNVATPCGLAVGSVWAKRGVTCSLFHITKSNDWACGQVAVVFRMLYTNCTQLFHTYTQSVTPVLVQLYTVCTQLIYKENKLHRMEIILL